MPKQKIWINSFLGLFLFGILFLQPNLVYSQKKSTIDSLSKLLLTSSDSNRIAILKQISWEYRNSDTSKAIYYGKKALEKAKDLNIMYEQADILGRIGVYYRNQGKFSIAMDFYFKGLEIAEKYKFKNLEALGLNNISDIYNRLGIYDQALSYVNKALKISNEIKDDYNLSYIYHMLGLIYTNSDMIDSAYLSFNKSLQFRKKLNYKAGIASSYLGIGMTHFKKENYDSSFTYYSRAIDIFLQINDKVGVANAYKNMGEYYNQRKEYTKAVDYFNKSMVLIKGFGLPQVNKEVAEGLTLSYTKLKDFENALYFNEYSTKISDSISKNIYIQKITRITENLKYEIKSKEQKIVANQLNEKIKNQRELLLYFFIALLILSSMIGVIIYFYRDKIKAYRVLHQKNSEIDGLNKTLTQANIEIEKQRDILQNQSDSLLQLNITKNKLFSIIAHDLRSPFTSINGLTEHLKENMQSYTLAEIETMIGQINIVGNSTLRILENLLDWAKMQTEQVFVNKEKLDISSLIQDNAQVLQHIADNKKIKIVFESNDEVIVFGDRNMINTVLRNIISNAIKYSNQDSKIVIITQQKQDKTIVSVSDSGVGMNQDKLSKLFNSNVNQSTFGTANEKGTGLGLAICNEFIKKLNGEIWATSEIRKGSTFNFSLPLS